MHDLQFKLSHHSFNTFPYLLDSSSPYKSKKLIDVFEDSDSESRHTSTATLQYLLYSFIHFSIGKREANVVNSEFRLILFIPDMVLRQAKFTQVHNDNQKSDK